MFKPTKEELKNWYKDSITQWVFNELDLMHKDYRDALTKGAAYNQESVEKTALKYAETVGFLDGLNVIKRLRIED